MAVQTCGQMVSTVHNNARSNRLSQLIRAGAGCVRERFEEQLRSLVRATSVSFWHDGEDDSSRPNVVSFDLPGSPIEGRPRLEAVFDPARPVDERARRMLGGGSTSSRLASGD